MKMAIALVLLLALTGPLASPPGAQEWSAWRGPDGAGAITGVSWNPLALDGGPRIVWRTSLGQGYSAVAVRGRFLYTMGNDRNQDTVYCLDARTGREIWRYDYQASRGSYPGPRATPVLDGNNLYTMSRYGRLISLNAANGRLNWETDIVREHGASAPGWDFSTSVLIHGDLVIVNAGRAGMAFDKRNGKLVWSNGQGRGGYATPVSFGLDGNDCVAIFSHDQLVVMRAETGRVLWSWPWRTGSDVNAADPLVAGNRIFISSGYGRGAAVLEMTMSGATRVWESTVMENHFSSSVLLGGHVYGIHGQAGTGRGVLKAVELATGRERWSSNVGMGSLIAVNDKLVILTEQGGLIIAEADPAGFRLVSRATGILPRLVWTPPVFSDGMLYLRNDRGDLVCVDMR